MKREATMATVARATVVSAAAVAPEMTVRQKISRAVGAVLRWR